MADTRAATGLTVQQWDDRFHTEYYQENLFSPLYGTSELSPIQIREDLTKKPGDSIAFAFLQSLTQTAITGSSVMEGAEEDLGSRSFRLYVDKRRNAVRISEMEAKKSAIGLREAAKSALKDWAEKDTRDLIIQALGSINGVPYRLASEAQKDAWLADNADRVLFGALLSNTSGSDHSASLANVDTTADKLTRTNLRLLKRVALNARNPRIRPVKDPGNGKRYFIAFAHPNQMRDLYDSMDATLQQTSVQAQASKIFEGGDLMVDGVIIKELDDLPVYADVGAAAAEVSPVYMLGAQAVGMAWGRRWKTVTEEFDYGDKHGVAIDGIFGVAKLRFGSGAGDETARKDHGVATGYFTSAADA
jgi:N4-gp56 family major capsid protein